ncbi:PREDICTED: basic leucine zipper 1-like [Camelina sativa]|uniref:Basic leucine zipper 1-like n=1 Tax=Camelina sativa TaxID=90675 RepID=A0ABM0UFX9_CAMSA|nr:PREDICTED: basic leucine zipper 1-like [Camelina sativa]
MANAEKTTTSSGSDIDEKKRKRKLSNRESARRSRLKKQKLMEDTIHEISSLERRIKENSERCRVVKDRLDSVETENAVLRSEKTWLSNYVSDLENMIAKTSLTLTQSGGGGGDCDEDHNANAEIAVGDCRRRRPWKLSCDSLQPMASFKT